MNIKKSKKEAGKETKHRKGTKKCKAQEHQTMTKNSKGNEQGKEERKSGKGTIQDQEEQDKETELHGKMKSKPRMSKIHNWKR